MSDWTDIKGTDGRYQISSDGSIRCMPHYVRGKNGSSRRLPMKVLELKAIEILQIKKLLADGEHVNVIAERFHVSRKVISKIKSGRSYAWINN